MDLGIDLGTSRTVICSEEGGVLLDEATAIALGRGDEVIACGDEAETMIGRTPPTIRAVHPVVKGVIAEYEPAELLLRRFLHRVCHDRVAKPCVAVSIAEQMTDVERRSFIEAVVSAGARRVTLVPETVAAAIGAGIDVTLPSGQMIVNFGGGTTDVSVISLKGEAASASVRTGGTAVDDAICRYLRAKYGVAVSLRAAETIKQEMGSAAPADRPIRRTFVWRDAVTGLSRRVELTGEEVAEAIAEPLSVMVDLICRVLEVTPPELAGDIMQNGPVLTGGMARLRGLPQLLERTTGLHCRIADDPDHCVAIGACRALRYAGAFSEVYDLGDFSYHLSENVTN